MSARRAIPRRAVLRLLAAGAVLPGVRGRRALPGWAPRRGVRRPERGRALVFPADHGPHWAYRIEWWYLTAVLRGADGQEYGVQWTLFRSALAPEEGAGWEAPQLWMGHAG
jgi:predicted secreted hydrolase